MATVTWSMEQLLMTDTLLLFTSNLQHFACTIILFAYISQRLVFILLQTHHTVGVCLLLL